MEMGSQAWSVSKMGMDSGTGIFVTMRDGFRLEAVDFPGHGWAPMRLSGEWLGPIVAMGRWKSRERQWAGV